MSGFAKEILGFELRCSFTGFVNIAIIAYVSILGIIQFLIELTDILPANFYKSGLGAPLHIFALAPLSLTGIVFFSCCLKAAKKQRKVFFVALLLTSIIVFSTSSVFIQDVARRYARLTVESEKSLVRMEFRATALYHCPLLFPRPPKTIIYPNPDTLLVNTGSKLNIYALPRSLHYGHYKIHLQYLTEHGDTTLTQLDRKIMTRKYPLTW